MPTRSDFVELGEQRLGQAGHLVAVEAVSELPTTAVTSLPCGRAGAGEPLRACRVLPPERAEPLTQSPGRVASAMGDCEERARIAAGSKLTEDAAGNLEMPFDDEVHDIMWKPRVIAGTARHMDDVAAVPPRWLIPNQWP